MKNYRIRKGKAIHVNQLASYSRKFTVSNTKNGISPVIAHKRIGGDIPKDKLITSPYTGIQYVMTNPHPIHGEKYGITVTGYDWVPIEEYKADNGLLWEHKKYPQPKNLQKKYKKKYYYKGTHDIMSILIRKSDYSYVVDGVKITPFKGFPYTLPKMNKVQYMEKLVEHKLAKWERKNVCPEAMFIEDVAKWKQERETMKERFRDFVVSIYDPLWIMGNRVDIENARMKASKIAEVKDVDGKGHNVNYPNLSTEDKLYKDANKKAQEAMNKDASIIDADLMNHKRNQKCPLEAKRAKTVTLADKRAKKAA